MFVFYFDIAYFRFDCFLGFIFCCTVIAIFTWNIWFFLLGVNDITYFIWIIAAIAVYTFILVWNCFCTYWTIAIYYYFYFTIDDLVLYCLRCLFEFWLLLEKCFQYLICLNLYCTSYFHYAVIDLGYLEDEIQSRMILFPVRCRFTYDICAPFRIGIIKIAIVLLWYYFSLSFYALFEVSYFLGISFSFIYIFLIVVIIMFVNTLVSSIICKILGV